MWVKKFSRIVFAVSVASLSAQHILLDHFVAEKPPPDTLAGTLILFIALFYNFSAGTLSLAITFAYKTKSAATALGILILSWILLRHVPLVVENLSDPAELNFLSMGLATAGGAFIVAGPSPLDLATHQKYFSSRLIRPNTIGKFLFGCPLIVFGIQHIMYADFVASQIPTWIPLRLFWAYATGTALIAAGISTLTALGIRWSGLLLAAMIGLWIILLHIPRIINHPNDALEFTSLFQALALSATAFSISGNTRGRKSNEDGPAKQKTSDEVRLNREPKKRIISRKLQVKRLES